MYQCMAYNDLDTRYSSGQLRVLGDTQHKDKWRPSFAKHPLEEKMFAAEQGNISIKYAYAPLALSPNLSSYNHWFWLSPPRSEKLSPTTNCYLFHSNSDLYHNITSYAPKMFDKNNTIHSYIPYKNDSNSSSYNYDHHATSYFSRISIWFFRLIQNVSTMLQFPIIEEYVGIDMLYNFLFPKAPLQCMFALDTSWIFQPLVINFIFSKSAVKLFAKVFLKNYFSKKIYKKYFKLFFKMLFRNLPKACIKLVFKYSFKVVLNVLAKIYLCFFLIYLIAYGKRKKISTN